MLKMHKQERGVATSPNFSLGGNKISFISLGCPRNLVDSEVMLGILLKAGYEPSQTLEEADHIVINTCGFLKASRDESLQTINDALEQRKEGAKVIVTGCMVQSHKEMITSPVDYFLGSGDVEGILDAVRSGEKGEQVTSAKSYLEAGEVPRTISTPNHYAYLKIAEGCRKQCAYCIIPTIKGRLKSKPAAQVLKEFRVLLNQGAKEVILIAQDLGDWGKDIGFKRTDGLIHLLKELLKVEGDYWLRLMYLYPDEITGELIQLMKEEPRICPYVDMPIQHVNDNMLKSMHRATHRAQIIGTIETMRKQIPDISIRTSLIVGFPGETEEQFLELAQFLEEQRLDNVGVFQFSREPGSHAYGLPEQIAEEVKQDRYDRLMQIQQHVVEQEMRKWVGRVLDVVIEGYHPETRVLMVGRHRGQCPEIDGQVLINDSRGVDAFGKRYRVEITDISGYDLVGRVI
ncbi:Ribosomal protein S12 methylthiotransferase RimO [Waddlia chondrophila 2032/99]|uniref:Ribosomal protein uS12 methylthiotransferase RimO n=1 Tax=Waddlia chondrophila 2032/99 TaxID=765953 RepID=F8LE88_9BACT|nr:Ribosomal protein S12 methylthiotransferase RimO [Waddlia chondrophila 2032/99]